VDILAWLRELGLERYEQAFRENEIAADILPKLTADDLKDIGVAIVGHRRKLLEAIAALAEPVLAQHAGPGARAEAPSTAQPSTAERRQLTVMFVDLVGSTALTAALDPEEMGAAIRLYQNAVAGETVRFEGHIAKFMGDGVLAYFGWPQAHEDDAERAVRAGLAVVRTVGGLEAGGPRLAARIGIATGLVVVGETPNLAARLQALAAPGSVVISPATRRLVGSLFELTDLGPTQIKGFAEPVAAFRVQGEGSADGRFEALHGQRLTPLIGREHELAMLLERWSWAKDGDGQVVMIAGEAGIGKSRLLRALREKLAGEPHIAISHLCSPYHTNSALYPIVAQLERAAGFASHDEAADRLVKLEALLAQGAEQLDEAAPLVGALLGVPTDDRYRALNLSPQRQKQRTFEVLIEQLAGLARERPVLQLYEDLHWADPSTLELLDRVVERARVLPVLVVITHRPQYSPPWSGQAHVAALPLHRLGRRQGAAMALQVTGGKTLPAEILAQILERTDGVPLFVEELTRTMLESGLLTDAGDRYEFLGPLPPLAIPANLHDSLMARLDRLAPVKELAQIGAVIGREFSHELIAAVADRPQEQLESWLDQLVASELMFRRGSPPDAIYSFKHALVKDAAYQSLLKSMRQQLHARVAHVFEDRFPAVAETQPELLAYHLTEAGLDARAADAWARAGRAALGRSAMRKAVNSLSRSVSLLQGMPSSPDRQCLELELLGGLGVALTNTLGPASSEAQAAHERADQLSQELGDHKARFRARWNLWRVYNVRAEYASAVAVGDALLAEAQADGDAGHEVQARHALWSSRLFSGDLEANSRHVDRALALYEVDRHGTQALAFGATTLGSAPSAPAALLCFFWVIRSGRWPVTRRASRTRERSGNRTWSCTPTTGVRCSCSSLANSKSWAAVPSCSRGSPTSTGWPYIIPKRASWPHGAPSTRRGITAPSRRCEISSTGARPWARSSYTPISSCCSPTPGCGSADRTRLRPRSKRAWPAPRRQASTFARRSCTGCARAPAWLATPMTLGAPRPLSMPRSRSPVANRRASSSFEPPAISPGFGAIGASGATSATCSRPCTAGSPKASKLPI
jgi:class 3 adenylate cyclase